MYASSGNQIEQEWRTEISSFKVPDNLILSRKDNEEIINFYNFSREIFFLYKKYQIRLDPLVAEFENKKNRLSFKQVYSEMIAEQYKKYLADLQNIEVPKSMFGLYKLSISFVKLKIEFFYLFSIDPNNKKLDKIKIEASLAEGRCWFDIYKKNKEIEKILSDL